MKFVLMGFSPNQLPRPSPPPRFLAGVRMVQWWLENRQIPQLAAAAVAAAAGAAVAAPSPRGSRCGHESWAQHAQLHGV